MRRYLNSHRIYTGPDHDLGGVKRTKAWQPPFVCRCAAGCGARVDHIDAICIACTLDDEIRTTPNDLPTEAA